MPRLLDSDLRARVELLTYLVASQLAQRQINGRWLEIEHLVQSTDMWLRLNGVYADWLQRVTLAGRSQALADYIARTSKRRFGARAVASMFSDGVWLNYRSPAVADIFDVCSRGLPGHIVFYDCNGSGLG
jgi:hypothetical protein